MKLDGGFFVPMYNRIVLNTKLKASIILLEDLKNPNGLKYEEP